MPGLGTIMNCVCIVVGSIMGVVLKRGLPQKWQETMMNGIALCIVIIGIQMAMKTNNIIITICSLVIGAIIGEVVDIELRMQRLGQWVGDKVAKGDASVAGKIAEGFVTATLLFCVGAMTIVGSIDSGISGDNSTLYSKSVIDCVAAIALTSSMGIGVIFASVSVLIIEGVLTLLAGVISPILNDYIISQMSVIGSLLIIALALNMLGITKLKVMNFVPALLLPLILCFF